MGGVGWQGPNLGPQPGQGQPPESPVLVELRQQFSTMQKDMGDILAHLNEKERQEEEERRETKHQEQFREMKESHNREIARLEAQHKEAMERLEKQQKEGVNALLEQMKGTGASKGEEVMRDEVRDLKERLRLSEARGHEKEVESLKDRLKTAETRETGAPTEMGLIQHTADKAIDAAREAGSAVKDVILGAQKGRALFPGRRSPEEREEVAKGLLGKVQKNQDLLAEMDTLFAQG